MPFVEPRFPGHVLMTADATGGVWRYAIDLAAGLIARGARVTLAVMGPPPGASRRAEAAAAGVTLETAPFRLEWMDAPWDDVDAAGEWLLELERKTTPDVVHVNGFAHGALPWRAPALVVAHSCVCSWWRAVHREAAPDGWEEYRTRVTRGLWSAAIVAAPTDAMRQALQVEYGFPAATVRVISNGRGSVTARSATCRAKRSYVLAAGRLWDPAKNVQALCAAAPSLQWPVFVAGDVQGPSDLPVVLEHVQWLGELEPDALQRWMREAAIYAHPARYEPFGLSVLEAAAAGCALVLGDIESLRETWQNAAVFVPPDDPRALGLAIQTLIAAGDERRRLGARARARACAFTVARMVNGYISAYADAMAVRRRRAS
jgi:glycosyltransferase involved in cell wall biosynthesis